MQQDHHLLPVESRLGRIVDDQRGSGELLLLQPLMERIQ